MKIISVKIYGFGKWSDASFELNQNLKIIYGNNEAGKTTLRAFIASILFGFATKRTPFEQYCPKDGSKYGGALKVETTDGRFIIERIEGDHGGKVKITEEQTGQIWPESFLEKWLGPVTIELFREVYFFDQDSLQQIGLLEPEELEKSLLSVGISGSQRVFEMQKRFQKKADEVYKPTGRVPVLNKLLKLYNQKKQAIAEMRSKTSIFNEISQDIQEKLESKKSLENQLKKSENKLVKLRKAQSLWPIYIQYQELKAKKTNKTNETEIDKAGYQELRELVLTLTSEKKMLRLAEDKIESLIQEKQKIESANLDYYNLHEDEFKNVFQLLDNKTGTVQRLEQLTSQLRDLQQERKRLIQRNNWQDDMLRSFSQIDGKHLLFLLEQNNVDESRMVKNESRSGQRSRRNKIVKESKAYPLLLGGSVGLLLLFVFFTVPFFWARGLSLVGLLIVVSWLFVEFFNKPAANKEPLSSTKTSIDEIKEVLADANCKMSYEVLSASRADLQQWFELTDKISTCHTELLDVEEQLTQVKKETIFCEEKLLLSMNIVQRVEQLQAYRRKIAPAIREQQEHLHLINYYENEKKKRLDKITPLTDEMAQKLKIYGTESITDFEAKYAAQNDEAADDIKLESLKQQLDLQIIDVLKTNQDLSEIEQKSEAAAKELENEKRRLSELITFITEKRVRLEQLGQYDKLQMMEQDLTNLQTEIVDQAENWVAFNAIKQWLKRILELSSQNTLPEVIQLAEKYFSRLTNQHFKQILLVKGRLKLVSNEKINYEVGELSRATTEQLYIALRFAFIVKANKRYRLPLMVDDAFVNFDKQRKENMISLLKEISKETQVLCFAVDIEPFCDKVSEEEILTIG